METESARRRRTRVVYLWSKWLALAGGAVALAASSVGGCSSIERESVGSRAEALSTTVSFQNEISPTTGYLGGQDATIKQATPTTNFGVAPVTSCEVDGDNGGTTDMSCLLSWDVSSIPSGSTVTAASITLRLTDTSFMVYDIYELLRPWNQAQVTWNAASSGVNWQSPGAFGTDRGAIVGTITGTSGTNVTVNLNAAGIARVQAWVNAPSSNAGFIVAHATNNDGIDFATSEHATDAWHPTLTVTYESGGGSGGSGSGGSTGGGTPTDPNLKVAFIGDTHFGTGSGFQSVLTLVKNEGASALLVQGDLAYESASPDSWWNEVDAVLGATFPVFIARGNHDVGTWSGYLPRAAQHLGGATRVAGAHNANYKTTYRGLVIATIAKNDTGARITPFLSGDPHIWKICQWHENQQAMQIGLKTDEMGWDVYETCRQQGAIIVTAHEHSYQRTRTLSSMSSQIVDSSCPSANSLCVGPGRTFASVSGLGGNGIRNQARCLPTTFPYGCNGEWGFIYTSAQAASYGAQFIVFNAGAPNVATGYFKTIGGQTFDNVTITHD